MTEGSGRQHDDGLKNPMRFSISNRTIDIGKRLRHPDFDEKKVTKIEIQNGQMYVHWDWSRRPANQQTGASPEST